MTARTVTHALAMLDRRRNSQMRWPHHSNYGSQGDMGKIARIKAKVEKCLNTSLRMLCQYNHRQAQIAKLAVA